MSAAARPIVEDDAPVVLRPLFIASDFVPTAGRITGPRLGPGYVSGRLTVRSPGACRLSAPADWYCDCACGAKRVTRRACTLRERKVYWCSMVCPLRHGDLAAIRKARRAEREPEWRAR